MVLNVGKRSALPHPIFQENCLILHYYLTLGMEIAVHWFGLAIDVQFWSQHISFILVGAIVVTSTRGLLLTMSKFFIWISSPKSSNFIVLFLSQIMLSLIHI